MNYLETVPVHFVDLKIINSEYCACLVDAEKQFLKVFNVNSV